MVPGVDLMLGKLSSIALSEADFMRKYLLFLMLFVLVVPGVRADDPFIPMVKLFQDKQYNRLELICQTRLKTNPKSLDSLYFLTLIRMEEGKANEAVPFMLAFAKYHNEFEKAQAGRSLNAPNFVNLYFLLGEYYVRHQQYDYPFPGF